VIKPIKRESGADFEKGIGDPFIIELVVFVNRYMFYGGFQAVKYRSGQTRHIKPFIYVAMMRHRECISRKSEIMQAGRYIRLAGMDRAENPLLSQ
jgi:hypothetical protein